MEYKTQDDHTSSNHVTTEEEQACVSDEYTDEYDYYLQLYQIQCNELYNPVLDQILGAFNTETPIMQYTIDYSLTSRSYMEEENTE